MKEQASRSVDRTISIMFPLQPTDIGTVMMYGRLAEQTQSQRLWCGQSLAIETHQVFAALAGRGLGLEFGSAVALTPLAHPATAAVRAQTVAALSGARYIAGFGPGAVAFQRAVLGEPYASPLGAMEQYLRIVRGVLDGTVTDAGEGQWHWAGIEMPHWDLPPVETGVGVLRTGMARLAGRLADWAITWLTPPSYLHDTLSPVIAEAAVDAQRPIPRIATVVPCAIDRSTRDLTEVAFRAAGTHLRFPHYTDMLRKAGIDVDKSDPRAGTQALLDAGVLLTGSAVDISAGIRRYHEAGVSDVILSVGGVHMTEGAGAALADLSAILAASEA
ncbi:LLM class flavin-dependent oxidoreductase [Nocardia amamiensis]|uniref:LLM class flavin-dependent oxidoreductase n=1 Tax=Nocardia amamiensis TaxID=404578 RepID=UPI0033FC8215